MRTEHILPRKVHEEEEAVRGELVLGLGTTAGSAIESPVRGRISAGEYTETNGGFWRIVSKKSALDQSEAPKPSSRLRDRPELIGCSGPK